MRLGTRVEFSNKELLPKLVESLLAANLFERDQQSGSLCLTAKAFDVLDGVLLYRMLAARRSSG
jgi:hypothetical protein